MSAGSDLHLPQALVAGAEGLAVFFIAVALLQNLLYILQLVLAAHALARVPPAGEANLLWSRYSDAAPPITLMAPAYNEELTVVESVRSLLGLQYPNFELVVVNDGSSDATLKVLIDAFELTPTQRSYEVSAPCKTIRGIYSAASQPRLVVVDKENGGKSDALNAAINLSRAPIVCSMDADSLLESDALLRAVRPFVDDPERTVAVGGAVRIANGCRIEFGRVVEVGTPRNLLALLQTVEYLRAFLMARLAWSRMGALLIISGAFGLFRRQAVLDVGGYTHATVGEDMELVVKLHRHFRDAKKPYRIVFMPEPVCWTEAPETFAVLSRQRARWQRGTLETFFRHRDMLFNPRYGRIGTIAFGHILLVDVLGPIIEVVGYVASPLLVYLGLVSIDYLWALLGVSIGFGIVVSVGALALEESKLRRFPDPRSLIVLTGAAVLENFGYRQLNNYWRLLGAWQFLTKAQGWGTMTRKGFAAPRLDAPRASAN
jgi:cellulose synthase/poly-beta-1,6-N-acetylglucosamine synthase-like glycosyltransferase